MKNKKYWDDFYSLEKNLINLYKKSNFAEFVFQFLKQKKIEFKKHRLLDVACGNGRDSFYFAQQGLIVTGIDLSANINSDSIDFYQSNLFEFDFSNFESIYLRFVIHSLTENEFDILIEKLKKECKNGSLIFIETRSSKQFNNEDSLETFFSSSEGTNHYRNLYSMNFLKSKLKNKFNLIYFKESKGLAIHKEEDPWIIRLILKNEN
jgi:SAM-dependent methyltransferase